MIFVVVQLSSHVWLFATPWTAARQASLSLIISPSLLKLMSTKSVMPSHPLLPPPPLALHLSQQQGLPISRPFASGGDSTGASVSASVLPVSIQAWFPLGLTGLISLLSKGLSRVSSNTTTRKHQFFGISLLYGPTLTPIYNYWKNHSFDYMDLCQQSDVSTF